MEIVRWVNVNTVVAWERCGPLLDITSLHFGIISCDGITCAFKLNVCYGEILDVRTAHWATVQILHAILAHTDMRAWMEHAVLLFLVGDHQVSLMLI